MTALGPAAFFVCGAAAGWAIHRGIVRADGRGGRGGCGGRYEGLVSIALSAVIPAALALRYQSAGHFPWVYGMLAPVLVGLAVFDLRTKTIPPWVTLPGILAGIVSSTFLTSTWLTPVLGFRNSILGAALGAGILIVTSLIEAARGREVGGGDWKLAAMCGAFLGVHRLIAAMILASLLGMIAGVVRAVRRETGPVALGPFLSLGAVGAMFWK